MVTSASLEIFSDYSLMSLQVSGICGDRKTFFVSFVKPHKSVTAKTLARWMKAVLSDAGVDPKFWAPHAVRSASSSHDSTVRNLDLGQICRLADWSMASKTFLRLYHGYVWKTHLSRPQLYLFIYILLTCIAEMFANYIAKNILQIFFGYVFYMSHILTKVRIDQGSLSLRHLSKCSWSTFPIFWIYRDLYQSGDFLNGAGLLFP